MVNIPKKYLNEKPVETLRAAIENQGKWIYFLTVEGLENGLSSEFAQKAMYELGETYTHHEFRGCNTMQLLGTKLMNRAMEKGMEAEADIHDEQLDLKIGYCPMLNMWGQLTADPERKKTLCAINCEMYRGLAEALGYSFERTASIASGCDHCMLTFKKTSKEG